MGHTHSVVTVPPSDSFFLVEAAKKGDVHVLKLFLQKNPALVFAPARGADRSTAWHMAAEEGHAKVLRLLVATTRDAAVSNTFDPLSKVINVPNARGQTPLMLACKGGHAVCTRLLLAAGADIFLTDISGRHALHHAATTPAGGACVALVLYAAGAWGTLLQAPALPAPHFNGNGLAAASAAINGSSLVSPAAGTNNTAAAAKHAVRQTNALDDAGHILAAAIASKRSGSSGCNAAGGDGSDAAAANVADDVASEAQSPLLSETPAGPASAALPDAAAKQKSTQPTTTDQTCTAHGDGAADTLTPVGPVSAQMGPLRPAAAKPDVGAVPMAGDALTATAAAAEASTEATACAPISANLLAPAASAVSTAEAAAVAEQASTSEILQPGLPTSGIPAAVGQARLQRYVDATDLAGRTPLHYAAWCGQATAAQGLLAAGASISVTTAHDCYDKELPSNKGTSALHLAAMRGHEEVVGVLLAAYAHALESPPLTSGILRDPRVQVDAYGNTPFTIARACKPSADTNALLEMLNPATPIKSLAPRLAQLDGILAILAAAGDESSSPAEGADFSANGTVAAVLARRGGQQSWATTGLLARGSNDSAELVTTGVVHQAVEDDTSLSEHPVPDCFMCPLTCRIFKEPVVAADGITYEANAISRVLATNLVSPITKQRLTSAVTYPNRNLEKAVEYWLAHVSTSLPGVGQLQ